METQTRLSRHNKFMVSVLPHILKDTKGWLYIDDGCKYIYMYKRIYSHSFARTYSLGKYASIGLKAKTYTWLVVWVLWHINFCRLFNAKSMFMQKVLFQTIQFSMSTQFNCQKHFYFKLFGLFSSNTANSVWYKYRFSLLSVKCQNNSILSNSV